MAENRHEEAELVVNIKQEKVDCLEDNPIGNIKEDFCDIGPTVRSRNEAEYIKFEVEIFNADEDAQPPLETQENDEIILNKYICNLCKKIFNTRNSLNLHNRIHEKPNHCDKCNIRFRSLDQLKRHKAKHILEKPLFTNISNEAFESVNHVITHLKEKQFHCTECNKSFTTRGNLRYHQNLHLEKKPYPCDKCDKSFVRLDYLKQHLDTHLVERPFSCEECHKTFIRVAQLIQHKNTHLEVKPYICSICNKSFASSGSLRQHRTRHLISKPFSCEECNISFGTIRALKLHNDSHLLEKPFSCNKCQKSFPLLVSLKRHENTHLNDKFLIPCDECNKWYQTFKSLRRHKKRHLSKRMNNDSN